MFTGLFGRKNTKTTHNPQLALDYALERFSRHSHLFAMHRQLSFGNPFQKFYAAGVLVVEEARERLYRFTLSYLDRRAQLHHLYISILAQKLEFDEANTMTSYTFPEAEGLQDHYDALQNEVLAADQRPWASQARLYYRSLIVHSWVNPFLAYYPKLKISIPIEPGPATPAGSISLVVGFTV